MVKSSFVFETGDGIEVGAHGKTDYVFHSGDPVPNDGDSSLVFESGTGLGGLGVLEDFEDPWDKSLYNGDTGLFGRTTTGPFEGAYAGTLTRSGDARVYGNDPSLSMGVDRNYRGAVYVEDPAVNAGISFLMSSSGEGYLINVEVGDNTFEINYYPGNENLAKTNVTLSSSTWYEIEFSKNSANNQITAEIFDSGTSLQTATATDSRRDSGNLGFGVFNASGTAKFDFVREVTP